MMRRSSVAGTKSAVNRRRSSIGYAASSGAGRRCSLSTFSATSRMRSNSKGHMGEDDIEMCHPPVEDLPLVPGYEDVNFEPYTVPPPLLPAITEIEPEEEDEVKPFKTIHPLFENDAREILIRYADSKCIFNKDAARDMKITSMVYQPRYKYTLESFTESRQIAWSYESHTGEHQDEFESVLPVPSPWSLEVSPPGGLFQMQTSTETVPRTDVITTCHVCGGVGSKRCNACSAAGWEKCSFCFGDGLHKISMQGRRERCYQCLGTGRKKCWKCAGDTIAVCRGCGGTGQIRCYISVTITWSNHTDCRTIESLGAQTSIDQKLEFAKGIVVFEEQKPMVNPIVFPESEEIRSLSASLLEKHGELLEIEKLILQRHTICTIPVYYITYEWKQRTRCFFIYGANNDVYAPEYPEQICCCCRLM